MYPNSGLFLQKQEFLFLDMFENGGEVNLPQKIAYNWKNRNLDDTWDLSIDE